MPEWLIERGIGETRCALVEDGSITQARIVLDATTPAGAIVGARLTSVGMNGRNALATDEQGIEYLLPKGARGATEGAAIAIEITRAPIPGTESWKRPLAKITSEGPRDAPAFDGRDLPFPHPNDELGGAGWSDLLDEARTGIVGFEGGELRISATPAMTLVDVDGYLPPHELAVCGAREAARATRRLDIGGSIGVDLPTAGSKVVRQEAMAAVDAFLPRPFERTAVNGFGFFQIVRPRFGPSLIELAQDRAAFEARALLRRVALEPAGTKCLVAQRAVIKVLESRRDWLEQFGRQIGGTVELRADAALPISGGYAQKL